MSVELTIQEKISIVEQHIRTLQFAQYNNSISLIELNALENPNAEAIDSLNVQISNSEAQLNALQNELNSLKSQLNN